MTSQYLMIMRKLSLIALIQVVYIVLLSGQNACQISNLSAAVVDCHPVQNNTWVQFNLAVDLDIANTASSGFDVSVNGVPKGFFQTAPFTVQNLAFANNTESIHLVVCANDQPDCCEDINVSLAPCFNTGECQVSGLTAQILGCQVTNNQSLIYRVLVDYEIANPVGQGADVYVNGEFYGFFTQQPPLVLQEVQIAPNANDFNITVCANDAPDCCQTVNLTNPGCTGDCALETVEVLNVECDATGFYNATVVLVGDNLGPTVTITNSEGQVNTRNSGGIMHLEFPVPDNQIDTWTICSTTHPDCCLSFTYELPCEPNPVCEIGPLNVQTTPCTANGQFFFILDFEHNTPSETFELFINNDLYEVYSYAQLPVEIGPFSGINNAGWFIKVLDASHDCDRGIQLNAGGCPGTCEVFDLEAEIQTCESIDDMNRYTIRVDFGTENQTSQGVDVFINNDFFAYVTQEPPFVLENVEVLTALDQIQIRICANDQPDCCQQISIPNQCQEAECGFLDLVAETRPCIDGRFKVDIAFHNPNPGPLGYYIFADGQISGPHQYTNAPHITLGPFEGDGSTVYDFLLLDIASPSCFGYVEVGPVDCSGDCQLSDLVAEVRDCENDQFFVDLSFIYNNVGGQGFQIRGNGQLYGNFEYGDPHITLGPLPANGTTPYEFVIIDNENPDCRTDVNLGPVSCDTCSITNLDFTIHCNPNQPLFALVNLDFEVNHPESDYFRLFIGNTQLGEYAYSALPLTVEGISLLQLNGETLTIQDLHHADCRLTVPLDVPCCRLYDMVVEAYDCEPDGTFLVDLDVQSINVSDSLILAYGPIGGTQMSQVFAYEDLYLTLGPLAGDPNTVWQFKATDQSLLCQTSRTLEPIYCPNEHCIEWQDADPGFYGPITGYDNGAEIAEEDGVGLVFVNGGGDNCGCYAVVLEETPFPEFTAAVGQVAGVLDAGLGFQLAGLPQPAAVISLDYFFSGTEISISINGGAPISADHPTNLPTDLGQGITLQILPASNDGRAGSLILTGIMEELVITVSGTLFLDNICITLDDDNVWPGDGNSDNLANHIDLLNIGVAFGAEGPERPETGFQWAAYPSGDWSSFFADGLNYKHADCNGDGIVNEADRDIIGINYGLAHGPVETVQALPHTEIDPEISVDVSSITNLGPGANFEIPIIFGTAAHPAEDVYGIAFTLQLDPNIIDLNQVAVVYPTSWFGEPGVNLITLDRVFAQEGQVQIAISRTDHNNVTGYGTVAYLIGVIDDIAGIHGTQMEINQPVAIDDQEIRIPVQPQSQFLKLTTQTEPPALLDLKRALRLVPNPTDGDLRVSNPYGLIPDEVTVLDAAGRATGLHFLNTDQLSIDGLPAGLYNLRIRIAGYLVNKQVVKVE